MNMNVVEFPGAALIGKIKTFGPFGPSYEIIEPVRQLEDGDWILKVRLVESGEEAEYRYTHVLDDPKAA